jgi:YVTN family beta-propeller protein
MIGGRLIRRGAFTVATLGMLCAAPAASADTLLVANFSSDNVHVIDTSTNAVVGSPITVGDEPISIVITPDGRYAYVASAGADTVSVIDVAARATVGSPIAVDELGTLAMSPDGAKVYVVSGSFIKTIDTATNTLDDGGLRELDFPSGIEGIAVTPSESEVWVAHSDPNFWVTRIRTDGSEDPGEQRITHMNGPRAIGFTPDGSRAYVTSENGGGVIPMDAASGAAGALIGTGGDPGLSIAISPDGSSAFVPSAGLDHDLYEIDLATNTGVSPTLSPPDWPTHLNAVAMTPDGSRVYVAGGPGPDPGQVAGFDLVAGELTGDPIDVGLTPIAMAIVPDQSPTPRLSAPATAVAGVPVQLDASGSSDPDGTVARFDWDFGDGSTAPDAGPAAGHTYAAGTYTAKVKVTDDEGCSSTVVFTGQTAYCSGSSADAGSQTIVVHGLEVGKTTRNARKGTATITVKVPAAGELTLGGKGLKSKRVTTAGPGEVTLKVQPKGPAKRKLKRKGKLTVHPTVTFTPAGGTAESQSLDVKLKSK